VLLELDILAGYRIMEVLLCMSLFGLTPLYAVTLRITQNTRYPSLSLSAASDTYIPLVPDNFPSLMPSEFHRRQSNDIRYPHGAISPKENASHDTTRSHAKPRGKICKKRHSIYTRSLAIAQELFSQS